jgi:hypothetical protein
MSQPSDRNLDFMKQTWGTNVLVTDYGVLEKTKMLREINNDNLTPKKHDFIVQNELHEKIRNQNDYDDWVYGTEPIPLQEW